MCLCVYRNVQQAMAVYKGAGIWNQVFTLVQQALNHILSLQMIFFLKTEARMWSIKQGCRGEQQGGSSKRPDTELPCGLAQQSHGSGIYSPKNRKQALPLDSQQHYDNQKTETNQQYAVYSYNGFFALKRKEMTRCNMNEP